MTMWHAVYLDTASGTPTTVPCMSAIHMLINILQTCNQSQLGAAALPNHETFGNSLKFSMNWASLSRYVCELCVCVSVPLRKTRFPVNWRLLL